MKFKSTLSFSTLIALGLFSSQANAQLWKNTSSISFEKESAGWTNKAEVADLNGDGRVDILFANGSAYSRPGEKERNQILINVGNDDNGVPLFEDKSAEILGDEGDFSRVIKARDINNDGIVDILVGNTYETQSRLFLGLGEGKFEEGTDLLPQVPASVGDLELGDIDGDGDLDMILADWNLESEGGVLLDPFTAPGGRVLVWRNELSEAAARFVDITDDAMPENALVAWSWEIEFIDVDQDADLDVLASCKVCEGSALFVNHEGVFTHAPEKVPSFTNNYDFEPMFIRKENGGDWELAVITINDGVEVNDRFDRREHIFVADENGKLSNQTQSLWPDQENLGADDNLVVVLDYDSDVDPDFLIGALGDGPDRLHINHLREDGTFHLDSTDGIQTGLDATPGTLGMALADFNGDGKLDVVQSQGELADPEQIWIGQDIKEDSAPPEILDIVLSEANVIARIHDNKSPSRAHDWKNVVLHWSNGEKSASTPMKWIGEFYWRADVDTKDLFGEICASDFAGNQNCSNFGEEASNTGKGDEIESNDNIQSGCQTSGPTELSLVGLLFFLLLTRRRNRSLQNRA